MSILRCIGRTDSLGDPHEYGSHIGFIYELPGGPRHTVVLDEIDTEELDREIGIALRLMQPHQSESSLALEAEAAKKGRRGK